MTDITELAQRMKAAAVRAKAATEDYVAHRMSITVYLEECKEFNDLSDGPDNILALVEALEKAQQHIARQEQIILNQDESLSIRRGELVEAQKEADELSKFKEVLTSAAEALKAGKPLNLESLFKGELASAMFAMMFAGEFVRSGATNYLELLYDVPEFGEMTVTLQKVEGKTPGQRIAELESRTVKLPDFRHEHFNSDWGEHDSEAYQVALREALTAAGIKWEAE